MGVQNTDLNFPESNTINRVWKAYGKDSQARIKIILLKVEPGFRRKGLGKLMVKIPMLGFK